MIRNKEREMKDNFWDMFNCPDNGLFLSGVDHSIKKTSQSFRKIVLVTTRGICNDKEYRVQKLISEDEIKSSKIDLIQKMKNENISELAAFVKGIS